MTGTDARILNVIDRCYAGVLDESAWSDALIAVADLVGGSGTFVFAMHPATQAIVRYDIARLDPEAIAAYGKIWAAHDIRVEPGLSRPVGDPQTEETLLPVRSLRRSAIYCDYLERHDLTHILATWLHRSAERVVALSIQGTRTRGAFTAAERKRLALVVPHLTRAINLKDRLAIGASVSSSLLGATANPHMGVLVIDESLCIVEASDVARRLLAAADGIYSAGQRLCFRRAGDARQFRSMMKLMPSEGPAPLTLGVSRLLTPDPLSLSVAPVLSRNEPWMGARRQWIVVLHEPPQLTLPSREYLARVWKLTAAEARVACLLASGSTVRELSLTLDISVNTARTHLKHIYAKTGFRTQTELVRELLTNLWPAALT